MNAKVPREHCEAGNIKAHHTQSIAQWALNSGKSIGLVTTTRGNIFCYSHFACLSSKLFYLLSPYSHFQLLTRVRQVGYCVLSFQKRDRFLLTLLFIFVIYNALFYFNSCTLLGVYAHTANRDWESNKDVLDSKCDDRHVDDIAEQLVYGEVGRHLKVIFGGGRRSFINETKRDEQGDYGRRTDGKDLITEWINLRKPNEQRTYVWNKVHFC